MKKKIIIANWKMKLGPRGTEKAIDEFLKIYKPTKEIEVAVCPTFTFIKQVSEKVKETAVALGAQDCFWEEDGAFTGEVSPKSLKELGCSFIIIGHSERRTYLKETDSMVHKKVKAALGQGLVPVICVGETFEERQEGNKDFVVMNQVSKAIEGLKLAANDKLIIAYEPVWVIGSGQAVAPEEAEHTHQVINQVLIDHFELAITEAQVRIIYGGSVDPFNIREFFLVHNVDGALVGGASLDPRTFNSLIEEVSKINK